MDGVGNGIGNTLEQYFGCWSLEKLHELLDTKKVGEWLSTASLMGDKDYLIDPRVGVVTMGLDWDTRADIDGSAVLLDSELREIDVVWFRNLKSKCGSVRHSGDNTTGEGSGDDETITIDLESIPLVVHHILFAGPSCIPVDDQMKTKHMCVRRGRQGYNPQVMCGFSVNRVSDSGDQMLLGQMTRKGGFWSFRKIGTRVTGRSVHELHQDPQNLPSLQRNLSFPPSFRDITVRVTRGTNLAAKKPAVLFGRKTTSDPYYIISYKGMTFASSHKKHRLHLEWTDLPFRLGGVMESETKPVTITVFSYNLISKDNFMGMVEIPARSFYAIGIGSWSGTLNLIHSKEKHFEHEDVFGEMHVEVTVRPSRSA